MDWCRIGRTTCQELPDCKEDAYIASTRTASSRRRWSNWHWETEDAIRVRISEFCTVARSITDKSLAKKRRGKPFSVFYWFYWRRNSLPSGFPRSFTRNPVHPSLHDNVVIPNDFFKYINHVGCYINLHSIIDSGSIAGGRNSSREGQTVFFTAVDPMAMRRHEQTEFDLTKPRFAQRKGLKFFQTRSCATILCDTLTSISIERVVSTKTQEVLHTKTYRSPPFKDNWQKDWKTDAAAAPNPSNWNEETNWQIRAKPLP